jgi:hypothetical protein
MGLMLPLFSKTASERPKIAFSSFIPFQVIALISLPIWFFFWLLFNAGKPVSERNFSIVIYFLFGSEWNVPFLLFLCSVGMWLAVVLRLKRTALISGIALCLPLSACFIILLLQYLEAYH